MLAPRPRPVRGPEGYPPHCPTSLSLPPPPPVPQLALHPSFIPDGMSAHDRRLYPCCVPTGRFCGKKWAWFDPCCEGRISTWTIYGSGVTSYFKNVKWLAWIFVLMTLFMLPQLVLNTFGTGRVTAIAAIRLADTTLGNLVGFNATSADGRAAFKIPFGGPAVPKTYLGLIYSLCDLGACLLLLLSWLWVRYFEVVEERQVDKDSITADDYTIFLPWVPHDTTEQDIRDFVARVSGSEENRKGFDIAEVHLVEDQMEVVSTYVARGRIFRQIERTSEKIARLEDLVSMGFTGCEICCSGVPGQIARLKRFKTVLNARAAKLSDKAKLHTSGGVVSCFVTFVQMDAAEAFLAEYPRTTAAWLFQRYRLRLREKRVRVIRAPAPSSVLWANLNVTFPSQVVRQAFTGTVTALLLIGSFLLLWFASWKQQEFQNSSLRAQCAKDEIALPLLAGTINATSVSSITNVEDPRLFCWCATQSWAGLSPSAISADPISVRCPDMSCPALFTADPVAASSSEFCVPWVRDRSIAIAMTIAAALSIIIINNILTVFMRVLTAVEGHHSFDDLNASLALRLFFAQFINTGVLMVIINASANELFPIKFATGKYDDFTAGWYETVGTSLMTTMLLNIITPHIFPALMVVRYSLKVRDPRLADRAPSQRDLNETFIGPYKDYAARYASLWNNLFVCFVFSTGMPLMIPIGAASFLLAYWIDKWLFIRFNRRPPQFSNSLQRTMSSLLPVAIVCHLAIGTWMISNISMFDTVLDPLQIGRYVNTANALFDRYVDADFVRQGAGRVTQMQAIPLLVLLALMVAVMLVRTFLVCGQRLVTAAWNLLTCGYCNKIDFVWEKDDLVYEPTYAEATDPKNQGSKLAIYGIPSYNMLMNPEIQGAFAITPDFARSHKTLAEVAEYHVANNVNEIRAALGASRRQLATGAGAGAAAQPQQPRQQPQPQPQQPQQPQQPARLDNVPLGGYYPPGHFHPALNTDPGAYDMQHFVGAQAEENIEDLNRSEYTDGTAAAYGSSNFGPGGGGDYVDEFDDDELVDDEIGGYLAGYAPAVTASSRYLHSGSALPPPQGTYSMRNLLQSGYVGGTSRPAAASSFIVAPTAPPPPGPPLGGYQMPTTQAPHPPSTPRPAFIVSGSTASAPGTPTRQSLQSSLPPMAVVGASYASPPPMPPPMPPPPAVYAPQAPPMPMPFLVGPDGAPISAADFAAIQHALSTGVIVTTSVAPDPTTYQQAAVYAAPEPQLGGYSDGGDVMAVLQHAQAHVSQHDSRGGGVEEV
jgi:hypothetical protein